jgi:hypothetical protein
MKLQNTLKRLLQGPAERPVPDLGRNDRCWCGSGAKYKSCHLPSDERRRSAQRAAAAPGRRAGRVI